MADRFVSRASRWSNKTLVVPRGIASKKRAMVICGHMLVSIVNFRGFMQGIVLVLGSVPQVGSGPFDPKMISCHWRLSSMAGEWHTSLLPGGEAIAELPSHVLCRSLCSVLA